MPKYTRGVVQTAAKQVLLSDRGLNKRQATFKEEL